MHELYDILDFKIVGPYTLWMKFDDGAEETINFFPILSGELYSPLKDKIFFDSVKLDPESKILVWPNGADFDPETLHNWKEYFPILAKEAAQWA
ncbi:MAG: DUF2442 domain-containing protein [bacterium]